MADRSKIDPPEIIWLQWHGDSDPSVEDPTDQIFESEVTWCRDKIFDHDIEYRIVKRSRRPRA